MLSLHSVFLRGVGALALVLILPGCGAKKPLPPVTALIDSAAPVKSSQEPTSPFSLEIVEELNDGANLHIHGRVQTATAWPAADIVVRLSGMKAGEARKVSFYPLAELQQQKPGTPVAAQVLPSTPLDFYLSVPSAELTDYQLELLWGREAKSVLPNDATVAPHATEGLVLQSLSVQKLIPNCVTAPCPSTYRLVGNLFNNSGEPVQRAELGVGFVWVPTGASLDLSSQIPQDEENVEITGLNLAPQQSRPFKLDIDRVVPEVPDGSFQPVVRILSPR